MEDVLPGRGVLGVVGLGEGHTWREELLLTDGTKFVFMLTNNFICVIMTIIRKE